MKFTFQQIAIGAAGAICSAMLGWAVYNFAHVEDEGVFVGWRKRAECREVRQENRDLKRETNRLTNENTRLERELERLKRRPFKEDGE